MEKRVVGALARSSDPSLWDIALTLPDEVFVDPELGVIFSVLKDSWRRHNALPDDAAFGRALRQKVAGDQLKTTLRLFLQVRRLANGTCTSADLEELRAAFEDRMLTDHIEHAVRALRGQTQFHKRTYKGIEGCRTILRQAVMTQTVEEALDPYAAYLRRKEQGADGTQASKILFGLLPPAQPGELHMLAGYASEGKTTLALNVIHSLPGPNLYVTMEAPSQRIHWARASMLSLEQAPILPYRKVKNGQLDTADEEHLRALLQSTAGHTRVVDRPAGGSSTDVMRLLATCFRERHYPVVVVDYLGLCASRGRDYGSQLGEFLRDLKGFAMEHNTVVYILHQINRAGWEAAKKRGFYVLGALSETNAAEQVPDAVVWIMRDGFLKSKIGCMKYRDEPLDLTRVVELSLDEETQVYSMEGEIEVDATMDLGAEELELPLD